MDIALLISLYLLVVFLVVFLLGVVYAVVTFNRLVRLKTTVETAFSDVDVHLTKRHNLVLNLAETVKGYAGHESGVFEQVAALRSRVMPATSPEEKMRDENALRGLISGLFAVVESYPALKADVSFQALQRSLQELEGNIETGRRQYNAAVRDHNILLKSFPASFIARMSGFTAQSFFESAGDQERQTPTVNF